MPLRGRNAEDSVPYRISKPSDKLKFVYFNALFK